MKTQQTIERDINSMAKHAEKIRNDATERVSTMSIGDVVRQGDVYLVRIACLPKSAKPIKDRQLAPGSTQGSRHVLAGPCAIYTADAADLAALIKSAAKCEVPTALIGPCFAPQSDVTIEHPEHAHRILPAECIGVVVYQRAFAEEVRRVRD